ncbi:unnamed protein product [Heterosigma akashiwo]|mmetsp:Transcript_37932/g.66316  ORF Transcript_37932/g.66316 Transcript_37932/m.66316 type:complete len:212 (-) Transcript_37932:684-1319(-)
MFISSRQFSFIILFALAFVSVQSFVSQTKLLYSRPKLHHATLSMISEGSDIPTGVIVDLVENTDAEPCSFNNAQDLGEVLRSHSKAVIFGVPGAFTPTCSAQHLPGFIEKADEIRAKGVDEIYCLSVNDRFVMKAWAEATPGCIEKGIKMIADGNAEYTSALGVVKDGTGSRMGLRAKRFAAIIEAGRISSMKVDEKGMVETSAEKILELL